MSKSNLFELDKMDNSGITSQGQNWSFFTDGVMDGLSEGQASVNKVKDKTCCHMTGNVTTENNGGFIQIRTPIKPQINMKDCGGIFIKVYGNNKRYSLFIRTKLKLAP